MTADVWAVLGNAAVWVDHLDMQRWSRQPFATLFPDLAEQNMRV
jgi:hypothetical protein